jgi:hypothetical protein
MKIVVDLRGKGRGQVQGHRSQGQGQGPQTQGQGQEPGDWSSRILEDKDFTRGQQHCCQPVQSMAFLILTF